MAEENLHMKEHASHNPKDKASAGLIKLEAI